MTTQTKAVDPAREAMTDYGRACYDTGYAQARADLIASMNTVAYLNDSATAAITADQMHSLQHHQGSPGRSVAASYAGQPLAIIPEK